MAKISIVIPVIGEYQCSDKTIFSILNQNFQDFEVIILSDTVIDNKLLLDDRIKSYTLPCAKTMPELLNLSIDYISSDLICFLNPQDLLLYYALKQRYDLFETNSDLDVSYGFGFDTDTTYKPIKTDIYDRVYSLMPLPENNLNNILNLEIFPNLSSLMIRKKVLNDIKFDNRYKIHCVWDFFIRLFQKNHINIVQNKDPVYLSQNNKSTIQKFHKSYPIRFLNEALLILDRNFVNNKIGEDLFEVYYQGYKNAFLATYFLTKEYFDNSRSLRFFIFVTYLKKNIQLNGKIFNLLFIMLLLNDLSLGDKNFIPNKLY